mmetsp:Transcript_16942/g.38271  ORF Transcript_16942/g.38271 Transcript_16942/m.38271 type:complete len:357 (+) Transcript_16942:93-1163(+)
MVYRCNNAKEFVCTSCCFVGVLLLICATILVHVSLGTLLPAITNLPENLETGLKNVLNVEALEAEIDKVKVKAEEALTKCSVIAPSTVCDNPPTNNPVKVDSSPELDAIKKIFDDTLKSIQKVTGDKYLGLAEFQGANNQLLQIQNDLKSFDNMTMPVECGATNPLFCGMYKSSDDIKNSIAPIKDGIKKISDNEALKEFKSNADNGKYLHALPYIMWIGMLFYFCFFVSEKAVCICRSGSGPACAACCCHSLFFLISLVTSVAVVFAGMVIMRLANNRTIEGGIVGKPTIAELIAHLEVALPEFYNVVLKDLLAGMKEFFDAQVIFVIADVVVLAHTCTTCCAGPYIRKDPYAEP